MPKRRFVGTTSVAVLMATSLLLSIVGWRAATEFERARYNGR